MLVAALLLHNMQKNLYNKVSRHGSHRTGAADLLKYLYSFITFGPVATMFSRNHTHPRIPGDH